MEPNRPLVIPKELISPDAGAKKNWDLFDDMLKQTEELVKSGIRVKDLKIEREYFDCDPPQEWLEKEPGGPITDEVIKEIFSDVKKSEIESALCDLPEFLDRVKKVLKL